jgi:rhodanese-related sulfurtransferase
MLVFALLAACQSATVPPPTPAESATQAPATQGVRADVDVDGLADALESGAAVIDVRTPQEFAEGHVPGAVNLPLGSFTPADPALDAYEGKPLYVICRSGGRSSRAADELAAGGFHAINVRGGTLAWTAAGRQVVK